MKLAVVAGLSLLALSTTAHAGGYVSAGLGMGPNFSGELDDAFSTKGHNSGRLFLGKSFGIIGIEGGLSGYGVDGIHSGTGDVTDGRIYALSVSVTAGMPVAQKLTAYGRLGLEHAWLSGEREDIPMSGSGWLAGAGISVDLGRADLWLELDYEDLEMEREGYVASGSAQTLMAGVKLDFGR